MSDPAFTEISGLNVSNNSFSGPPGSLLLASNSVIPQKGVAQPRRGQERAYVPPTAFQVPFAITEFLGSIIINSATLKESETYTLGIAANPTVDFGGGPWNPVDSDGSTTSNGRMKFGFGSGFLNFCTTTGPHALERVSDLPRRAGLFQMPDMLGAPVGAQVTPNVWLAYGSSVAYRSLCRVPVTGGRSLLSPPSGRFVVTNRILAPPGAMVRTGGTTVTVTIPGAYIGGINVIDAGDTFELTPGEADFAAGTYTVATVTGNVFTYADAGSNVANTIAQDFDTGPRAVGVSVFLSPDAATTHPVRIYRSLATASEDADPGDEMFLVAEIFPTGTNVSNGFVGYIDGTSESVINNPLYTNPQTGEGSKQENSRPPLYRDLAFWGSRMWYFQNTQLQAFELQILGVGTPDGIQAGDTVTLTIDSTPYEFQFGPGFIAITDDSTPSVNILRTTQRLIASINFLFSPGQLDIPVKAFYLSGQSQAPGRFMIQRQGEGDAFQVQVSRKETWVPAFQDNTDQDSVAEYIPNGLAYSKLDQPEAVPTVNRTTVGARNFAGARCFGLRNALIVMKQGDGIYSVTGAVPFNVQQIGLANTVAPDCACTFQDDVWAYTDQGIVRVSDSGGIEVVSRPIETLLNEFLSRFPQETYDYSFAVGYETERRVYFYVPIDVVGGEPVMGAFVFNDATKTWTGPVGPAAFCGVVGPETNKLYLGVDDTVWGTGRVTRERKGNNPAYLDYADADFAATISAVASSTEFTLSDATDVEAGDVITQIVGGLLYATKVDSVDGDLVTVLEAGPWEAAACTVYKGYEWLVQFQPTGHPATRKTITRLQFVFKPEWYNARTGAALLMTDQVQAELPVEAPIVGFGSNPFGSSPFGDPSPMVVDVNPLDPKWANGAQFFIGLRTHEAWMKVKLQGYGAQLMTQDGPAGRGK